MRRRRTLVSSIKIHENFQTPNFWPLTVYHLLLISNCLLINSLKLSWSCELLEIFNFVKVACTFGRHKFLPTISSSKYFKMKNERKKKSSIEIFTGRYQNKRSAKDNRGQLTTLMRFDITRKVKADLYKKKVLSCAWCVCARKKMKTQAFV